MSHRPDRFSPRISSSRARTRQRHRPPLAHPVTDLAHSFRRHDVTLGPALPRASLSDCLPGRAARLARLAPAAKPDQIRYSCDLGLPAMPEAGSPPERIEGPFPRMVEVFPGQSHKRFRNFGPVSPAKSRERTRGRGRRGCAGPAGAGPSGDTSPITTLPYPTISGHLLPGPLALPQVDVSRPSGAPTVRRPRGRSGVRADTPSHLTGRRRRRPADLRSVLPLRWAMGLDQFLHRAAQQRLAAEGHAQCPDLPGVDLVLRPAVEVGDLARAAGQLLRHPRHLLLGDVPVVAVERLAGDRPGVGVQQQLDGAGDVGGVDLLAALRRGHRLAAQHLADEVVPAAVPGGWASP